MSYILNALRKSERERQAIQPEKVTDRILVQPPAQSRKSAKWISAIILCNVLIIAGFIWYTQKTLAPSATHGFPTRSTIENAAIKHEVKPITLMNRATEQTEKSPVQATAPAGREATANKPAERRSQSPSLIAKPGSAVIPDTSFNGNKTSNNKEDKSVISVRRETHPVPDKTNEKAPPKLDNEIPFLYELPYEFRQSIPKMTINVFVYSSVPAERFVMINMVKYKAGQLTKDSVEIKDIRPESLVVSFENRLFQIERP